MHFEKTMGRSFGWTTLLSILSPCSTSTSRQTQIARRQVIWRSTRQGIAQFEANRKANQKRVTGKLNGSACSILYRAKAEATMPAKFESEVLDSTLCIGNYWLSPFTSHVSRRPSSWKRLLLDSSNPFDSPRSEVDPNLAADNKGIIYFSCPTWSNDILNIWLKED